MLDFLTQPGAKKFIDQVGQPFANLPHLPKGLVEFLVKVAPWLVGLGAIFEVFGGLSNLGMATGMRRYQLDLIPQFTRVHHSYFALNGVFQLIMAFLGFSAFKFLRARKLTGWIYIFWSNIVSIAQTVVGLLYFSGSIFWSIFAVLLGLYVLFEVKPAYLPATQKKSTPKSTKTKTKAPKTRTASKSTKSKSKK